MTTEIFLEDNQLALTTILLIGLKLITENLRVSLTEAVDRLLDIPHHKAIFPSGKQVQHALLCVVGILILIHHDLVVALLIKATYLWKSL